MKNSKIKFFIAVLILVSGLSFLSYRQSTRQKITTTINQNTNISISQTIELEKPITLDTHVKSGTMALDLLKLTTKIETKGEGENAYVVTINDRTASNTNKEYWAFYVNGKPAAVGAGSYKLKPNDKILWKIEKFQ